jgi:hypothetical protein
MRSVPTTNASGASLIRAATVAAIRARPKWRGSQERTIRFQQLRNLDPLDYKGVFH